MASPDELPEFVRDSKLRTEIHGNQTIHTQRTARRGHPKREIWTIEGIAGQGGGGVVLLQRQNEGSNVGSLRAVKRIQLNTIVGTNPMSCIRRFVRELEASAKFSQKKYEDYFVKSYGWYHTINEIFIAMEYCELGDLGRNLRERGIMPEDEAKDVIYQVVTALRMMHVEGFAHRDLKPSNILIVSKPPDREWWVKLCDLGLSRRSSDASGTTTMMGTPQYMAPEMIGGRFSGDPTAADPAKADMWCVGETLFQALTGSRTFDDETLYRYQKSLASFPVSRLENLGISQNGIDFICSLMAPGPRDRPDARQALGHAWMPADSDSDSSISNENGLTLLSNHERPNTSTTASIVLSAQLTQASAQWTTTSPISHFAGPPTQASGQWTTTVATEPRFSTSNSNEIAPRLPGNANLEGNTPVSDATKSFGTSIDLNNQLHDELYHQYQMLEMQSNSLRAQLNAQQQAQQARFAYYYPDFTLVQGSTHSHSANGNSWNIGTVAGVNTENVEEQPENVQRTANLGGENKREAAGNPKQDVLSKSDESKMLSAKPRKPEVDAKLLDSFKKFAHEEKRRVVARQGSTARELKAVRLNDLKKFSQDFKLPTPVPQDLVPILAKDERRQQEIVEKTLLQAQEWRAAKNEQSRQDAPSPAEKARGVVGLPPRAGEGGTAPNNPSADSSLKNQVPSLKEPSKPMTWAQMAAASNNSLRFAPASSEPKKPAVGLAQSATSSSVASNSTKPTSRIKRKKKRAGTTNSINPT